MHGLRLIIKENVLPIDYPKFEAIAEVAKRGLFAPETWHSPVHQPQNIYRTSFRHCYRTKWRRMPRRLAHARRLATALDGAVRQKCIHRTTTLRELHELLQACDMKRNLVELNYEAAQWSTWKPSEGKF